MVWDITQTMHKSGNLVGIFGCRIVGCQVPFFLVILEVNAVGTLNALPWRLCQQSMAHLYQALASPSLSQVHASRHCHLTLLRQVLDVERQQKRSSRDISLFQVCFFFFLKDTSKCIG